MKKRLFQILDEMNQHDAEHNTKLVRVSPHLISAEKVKQGSKISMGAEGNCLGELFNGNKIPLLVLVDREEYYKREKL